VAAVPHASLCHGSGIRNREESKLEKQIVRLLLDSAIEFGKAREFVAQLKAGQVGGYLQQRESILASWLRSSDVRKRANAIARNDPAGSAAVILKWMNDGK
jgi:hypothetical protein